MANMFKILFVSSLRDKLTIFWSIVLPIVLLFSLGYISDNIEYKIQVLAAVTAMGILFNGLWGMSFEVILNRKSGVFKILRVTPIKTRNFILISSLSKIVVSLVVAFLTLILGIIIFNIEFEITGLLLLIPLFTIGILTFIFLGYWVGNIADKETQVSMIANLIGMPLLLLSNSFYQLPTTNPFFEFISLINPFEYFMTGIKDFTVGNYESVLAVFGVMVLLMIISYILATITFRWDTAGKKNNTSKFSLKKPQTSNASN